MIKAIFFDLYYTLINYEPSREELQAKALRELGIEVSPEALKLPLIAADEFIYQEIARVPIKQRPDEDKTALFIQHQQTLLREAGIENPEKLAPRLLDKMRQYDMKLVLFDDVKPALTDLKNRGLKLGLISNIDRDITPLLNELGISPLLEVVVTSQDTGFNKPQPEIFQEALRQARIQPSEAMYVGDQYQIDIVGAEKAGMKGVLLDRNGLFASAVDCQRAHSLTLLGEHLEDNS